MTKRELIEKLELCEPGDDTPVVIFNKDSWLYDSVCSVVFRRVFRRRECEGSGFGDFIGALDVNERNSKKYGDDLELVIEISEQK